MSRFTEPFITTFTWPIIFAQVLIISNWLHHARKIWQCKTSCRQWQVDKISRIQQQLIIYNQIPCLYWFQYVHIQMTYNAATRHMTLLLMWVFFSDYFALASNDWFAAAWFRQQARTASTLSISEVWVWQSRNRKKGISDSLSDEQEWWEQARESERTSSYATYIANS